MSAPSSYFFGPYSSLGSYAAVVDTTPPTFAGITGLVANSDGSFTASWSAGSDAGSPPIEYDIFIQASSATGLFNPSNVVFSTKKLSARIFTDATFSALLEGTTYFVGVRAKDAVGNTETNTVNLNAPSSIVYLSSLATQISQIISTLGTPANATIAADIAEVEAETDGIANIPTNPVLATDPRLNNLANLDAAVSTRSTQTSVDTSNSTLGTVNTNVNTINTGVATLLARLTATRAGLLDDLALIPQNPLLTTDSRLNNLDAKISLVSTQASLDAYYATLNSGVGSANTSLGTLLGRLTATRAGYLDDLPLIPQNPLLTTDARLNNLANLDATVSSRASQSTLNSDFTTLNTGIGNANTSLGTLTSLLTPTRAANLDNLDATVSTRQPTATALTQYNQLITDLNEIAADTDSTLSTLGTPAGSSLAADIALVESQTLSLYNNYTPTRATKLDNLDAAISTRQSAATALTQYTQLNSNDTEIAADTDSIISTLGTPVGASVSADIAGVKTDTGTLTGRLTVTRAGNLDFLDVSVASRQSAATALAQFNTMASNEAGILSAIQAVQNNTNFVAIVPEQMELPSSGSNLYNFYVNMFDNLNMPHDPDSNIVNYTVKKTDGTVVVASTAMTRTGTGHYTATYSVLSTDTFQSLEVFFNYTVSSVAFQQIRITDVVEFESGIDVLLSRLTATRAALLDNLDVAISTRQSTATALSQYNNLVNDINSASGNGAQILAILGTPAGASMSADIAQIEGQTGPLFTNYTAARAAKLDFLDVAISTRADAATQTTINTNTAGLRTDFTTARAIKLDNLDATISSRADAATQTTINTNTAGLRTDYTTARAAKLDNLDAAVSLAQTKAIALTQFTTIEGQIGTPNVSLAADIATVQTGVTEIASDVDVLASASSVATINTNVNTLLTRLTISRASALDFLDVAVSTRADATTQSSIATVVNAIRTDYTTARASKLDFLDVAITTRADAATQTTISTNTAGLRSDFTTARAGKLDHLDVDISTRADAVMQAAIHTDTTGIRTDYTTARAAKLDHLDVDVSTRADGTVLATINTNVAGLRTDYTTARAALLDNLDVPVSSRANQATTIGTNALVTLFSTYYTQARATKLDFLDAFISSRASQASISSIQNNTNFTADVPGFIELPLAGSQPYKFTARFFDLGIPTNTDAGITIRIENMTGTVVVANTLMANPAVGQYQFIYTVTSLDPITPLLVFFEFASSAVNYQFTRSIELAQDQSGIDTLLARLSPARAANLDNIDVPVSTIRNYVLTLGSESIIGTVVEVEDDEIVAIVE